MSDGTRAIETDPSVCYRHPGRQSWVLCQRCGRTVCPECQIQAPVGVHCPDCVAETSGGVSWRPTNVAPLKPKRRRASRRMRSMLQPAGLTVNASSVILGAAIALFVVGVFSVLPFLALAAVPGGAVPLGGLQVWRWLTAPLVSTAGGVGVASVVFFALSCVFFWLTVPQLERMLGTRHLLGVLATASVIGNAGAVLAGGVGSGLAPLLFGSFTALLVLVWEDQRMRTQILVMLGINLLITLVGGGASALALLVGGAIGGAGAVWLARTGPDRGWKPRTPVLLTVGVCVLMVVFAVLRSGF